MEVPFFTRSCSAYPSNNCGMPPRRKRGAPAEGYELSGLP
ncbi:hypothetical protein KIPB_017249, partial [Kipferlia bialata]|eukprot:g17249.t1